MAYSHGCCSAAVFMSSRPGWAMLCVTATVKGTERRAAVQISAAHMLSLWPPVFATSRAVTCVLLLEGESVTLCCIQNWKSGIYFPWAQCSPNWVDFSWVSNCRRGIWTRLKPFFLSVSSVSSFFFFSFVTSLNDVVIFSKTREMWRCKQKHVYFA